MPNRREEPSRWLPPSGAQQQPRRPASPPEQPGQFGRGLRFGAGFAVSWVLIIFIGLPLLFIGGCAVLVGSAAHSVDNTDRQAGKSRTRPTLTAGDHRVLQRRAMDDVRYHWSPPYRPVSARCIFQRIDTVGPDSWDYSCLTIAAGKSGRHVTFREVIPCFAAPPYADDGSCGTAGQTPQIVRHRGA